MLGQERGLTREAIARALRRGPLRAGSRSRSEDAALERASLKTRRRIRAATIPNGSRRVWPVPSAKSGPRRPRRSPARAARSARQYAQGRSRGSRAGDRPNGTRSRPRWSPWGLRHRRRARREKPREFHAEPAFLKGQIEIQDEGSQIAALLTGRAARRAGDRSLRRRRRQDARARSPDGQSRPALRGRHRQAPPRADP